MARKLMNEPLFRARTSSYDIGHLHHGAFPDDKELAERERFWPGSTWLLGYRIPSFQRELKWDDAQMARFVESAWNGFHLGTYVVNDAMDGPKEYLSGKEVFHHTDRWLIDGQQRLWSLDRYFNDAFKVGGYYWSELPKIDQLSFRHLPFAAAEVKIYDEMNLRRLYDLMNFGGVAHEAHERAIPTEEDGQDVKLGGGYCA